MGYYYKSGTTKPIFGIVGGTKRIYENIVNKNRIRKEILFYERITSIHNYNEYNYDNLGNLIKIESKTIKNNIAIKVDELTLETIGNIQSKFSSENKLEIEFDNELKNILY